MDSRSSISAWIAGLKGGQAEAVQKLWERYSTRLVELARQRLNDVPKHLADEDDIAQSVFSSLWRGAKAGRFDQITNRDELWWLLVAITRQKTVDHMRRETALRRGSGKVRSESAFSEGYDGESYFSLDHLIGEDPTPEFLVALEEQQQRLMNLLRDDGVRRVASARIEGYTVNEIAEELSISTRSVERKLQLIRNRSRQPQIVGLPHLAHRALANLLDELEPP